MNIIIPLRAKSSKKFGRFFKIIIIDSRNIFIFSLEMKIFLYQVIKLKKAIPKTIKNPEVATVFKQYPPKVRAKIKNLRRIILEVAASDDRIGALEETLKWGEPSYLTSDTKSGSTVRIDWKEKTPEFYAIYFKCTANIVEIFKKKFDKNVFTFSGKRAILFNFDDAVPEKELKYCIAFALTYHLHKKLPESEQWQFIEEILNN